MLRRTGQAQANVHVKLAMKIGWRGVDIGGVQQWVSVRGQNASAPVLLFLHGGPGGSEYGPRRKYLRELERCWRVVDWDQRGTGRSFRGDEDATVLTLDRLVLDGVELVEWICNELAVERVVLVGHSFGTVLGVLMSQKAPARIAVYVGAAQVPPKPDQLELMALNAPRNRLREPEKPGGPPLSDLTATFRRRVGGGP
jgi:pimeloyl-ACP methyl ester carboxylesterase